MLEESKMDKKNLNRTSQLQSRSSAIDCKKNTDLTHKPWPRNSKKREGPAGAPKNEPSRRNIPSQRGRGQIDRKARVRGSSNFTVGGTENTGIEDGEGPEYGSVENPGSKKQSLNHLLKFTYRNERPSPPQRRPVKQYMFHRHVHDLYLRSYCQFVVKEDGDYNMNLENPDIPVNWDQIEEIVVRNTGRSECPICLGPPVAGRVGLCGHVFCWACALHYAAVHEKQPPPCPVCTTPLQVKHMKPTRILQWESPSDEITMRLVRRLRGTNVVEVAPPHGQVTRCEAAPILTFDDINNSPFTKFFKASKDQVHEILLRDRNEIEKQILAEIDTTEIVYLEEALDMLKLNEEINNTQCSGPEVVEEIPKHEAPIVIEKQELNKSKLDWFDVTDEGAASVHVAQEHLEERDVDAASLSLNPEAQEFTIDTEVDLFPINENSSFEIDQTTESTVLTAFDKENESKYFYFYQADDGQLVFLDKVNVQVLRASWGSLAAAPLILRGRVLNRETHSLTAETAKKSPLTSHLPLHCAYDVVELDLKPPHVTVTALKEFAGQIQNNAKKRAKQEREERRRERAYLRAQEGPPKPDFSSELLFPPAGPSNGSPPLSDPSFLPLVEEPTPSTSADTTPTGLSFAKMASTSGTWRVRKVSPPPPPLPVEEEPTSRRSHSFSEAFTAALQAGPSSSGKKKKKSKPKVLFSTGMHHAA